jgi:AraC family transcriptional regulator
LERVLKEVKYVAPTDSSGTVPKCLRVAEEQELERLGSEWTFGWWQQQIAIYGEGKQGVILSEVETFKRTLPLPVEGVELSELTGVGPTEVSLPASSSCFLLVRMASRSQVRFEEHGRIQHAEISTGQVMVRPGTGPMSWWFSRSDHTVLVQLSPEFLQRVSQSSEEMPKNIEVRSRGFSHDLLLHQTLERLLSEIKSNANVNRLYTESLIIQLSTHLVRRYSQDPEPDLLPSRLTPSRLRRVIEFISTQIDQEIGLEQLAQVAGISPFYFCREFKRSTGFTPHHYVMQRRIELSKRLLESTEKSITDISVELGFPTPSHFAATFRKLLGLTPTYYRRQFMSR